MRSILILKGGFEDSGRLIRRIVHRGMLCFKIIGTNLTINHLSDYSHVSPYVYPLSRVLHYRMEPEHDNSQGRSSKSQSGYDILGCSY